MVIFATLNPVFLAVYDCLEGVPALTGIGCDVALLAVAEGDICLTLGDAVYSGVHRTVKPAVAGVSVGKLVDVSDVEGAFLDGDALVGGFGCGVDRLGLVADEHLFESFNVLYALSGYPLAGAGQFLFCVVEISQQGLCTCRVEKVERFAGVVLAGEVKPVVSQSSVRVRCGVLVDCVAAAFNVEVGFSFDFGDIGDVAELVVRVDSSRNGLAFGGACGDGQGLAGESLGGFGAGDVEYVVAGDEDVCGVDGCYDGFPFCGWFTCLLVGVFLSTSYEYSITLKIAYATLGGVFWGVSKA